MSDHVPIAQNSARSRTGIVVAAIILAFLVGAVAMGFAMKHVAWLGGVAGAEPEVAREPEYTPAQPLGPGGAPAPVDLGALASRETALAGQVGALEARLATVSVDAAAAGTQATRAEGLMVAFAARRALERGVQLGYLEEQLRLRFGQNQPRAVSVIVLTGRQPVTREDLRRSLDALAPDLASGAHGDGWLSGIGRELGQLVILRKASTPSPLPYERLARARRLLESGQVAAAITEVERLPGGDDADGWIAAAKRYVTSRQALDVIEGAAILGQAAPPPSAPASVPVPTSVPAAAAPGR